MACLIITIYMKTKEKYFIKPSPDWVEDISKEKILEIVLKGERSLKERGTDKAFCYLYRNTINTSNKSNQINLYRIWALNTPDYLQTASVSEIFLSADEYLEINKVLVVREGVIVDKIKDLIIRVIDNETDSINGSILNNKKINIVINDLRLGDIFIYESTVVNNFNEKSILDQKYFRYVHSMPSDFWFYNKYNFILIQSRKEEIKIIKKYFRNESGEKLADEHIILKTGESFNFEKQDFQTKSIPNTYNPFIEIATNASWGIISKSIFDVYNIDPSLTNLKNHKVCETLELNSNLPTTDKIRSIIEYVQNQIIYLYDADFMHNHIPELPSKTLEFKAGDCKAKSFLLVYLLKVIDVHSEVILVNYNYDYHLPNYIPSPFIFNHAIVKITFNDKAYFVDPTIRNRYGILGKRSEENFRNYLPVCKESSLAKRIGIFADEIYVERNIDINVYKEEGVIKMREIFKITSADIMRDNFQNFSKEDNLRDQNIKVLNYLSYHVKRNIEDVLYDIVYKVESDDKRNNELITTFEAKLKNPYEIVRGHKVLRCWYTPTLDPIENHNIGDFPCSSFVSYPILYNVSIKSDLFVNRKESIMHNVEMENDYFYLSNIGELSDNGVKVTSKFRHKDIDIIKNEDFEKAKADYLKINNNFGVGLIYVSKWISRWIKIFET